MIYWKNGEKNYNKKSAYENIHKHFLILFFQKNY